MSEKDDINWGERIQGIVEDAVETKDFDRLSRNIQESIDDVFGEWKIGPGTGHYTGQNGERIRYSGDVSGSGGRRSFTSSGTADRNFRYDSRRQNGGESGDGVLHGTVEKAPNTEIQLYKKPVPGTYSGPACMIVGGIGTGLFALATLICDGVGAAMGDPQVVGVMSAILLPLTAAFGGLTVFGTMIRGRAGRFKQYVQTLGGRTYCEVKELAEAVGKNDAYVRKDLNKMIAKGFFLQGHMDRLGTTLMVDDATYKQYLATDESYQARVKEETARRQQEESIFSTVGIDDPEFVRTIQEGNDYIREIREANESIPGEEISAKLLRLESVLKKIFEVLKQKPDELGRLRKFMNYYMPTTRKLVQTYRELDAQPVEGENIRKAKAEIEQTLDTINNAYEKLLDSFYEDALLDVHTDRKVLESMLTEDGLSKDPFAQQPQAQQGQ